MSFRWISFSRGPSFRTASSVSKPQETICPRSSVHPTVAEVVSGRAKLKDKPVTVRAQVVKLSKGILGKNWLHLQDGSGAEKDGSHDILVTSTELAAVGDIVTVRGTVHTDVDLGSGYRYEVMIGEATLKK